MDDQLGDAERLIAAGHVDKGVYLIERGLVTETIEQNALD